MGTARNQYTSRTKEYIEHVLDEFRMKVNNNYRTDAALMAEAENPQELIIMVSIGNHYWQP